MYIFSYAPVYYRVKVKEVVLRHHRQTFNICILFLAVSACNTNRISAIFTMIQTDIV